MIPQQMHRERSRTGEPFWMTLRSDRKRSRARAIRSMRPPELGRVQSSCALLGMEGFSLSTWTDTLIWMVDDGVRNSQSSSRASETKSTNQETKDTPRCEGIAGNSFRRFRMWNLEHIRSAPKSSSESIPVLDCFRMVGSS